MASVAAFLTPIGRHGNLLVYGPGHYQFGDFARVGTPLTILAGLVVAFLAPLIWHVNDVPTSTLLRKAFANLPWQGVDRTPDRFEDRCQKATGGCDNTLNSKISSSFATGTGSSENACHFE